MTTILSIDWDYFFPEFKRYCWSAKETKPELYEEVWIDRCGDLAPGQTRPAAERYRHNPDLLEPLLQATDFSQVKELTIEESHAKIVPWISDRWSSVRVVNYDQHHDWAYVPDDLCTPMPKADCACWASAMHDDGILERYEIVYPSWRCATPEVPPELACLFGFGSTVPIHYRPVRLRPDAIFLCRSGHWTPPWDDRAWMYLIRSLIAKTGIKEITAETDAIRERTPNSSQAINAAGLVHGFTKDLPIQLREMLPFITPRTEQGERLYSNLLLQAKHRRGLLSNCIAQEKTPRQMVSDGARQIRWQRI